VPFIVHIKPLFDAQPVGQLVCDTDKLVMVPCTPLPSVRLVPVPVHVANSTSKSWTTHLPATSVVAVTAVAEVASALVAAIARPAVGKLSPDGTLPVPAVVVAATDMVPATLTVLVPTVTLTRHGVVAASQVQLFIWPVGPSTVQIIVPTQVGQVRVNDPHWPAAGQVVTTLLLSGISTAGVLQRQFFANPVGPSMVHVMLASLVAQFCGHL
jgi:hypothetical protein